MADRYRNHFTADLAGIVYYIRRQYDWGMDYLMIYKTDHYNAIDHDKFSILIESHMCPMKMAAVIATLEFLLEEIYDFSTMLDNNCLLDVLYAYYGALNAKMHYFPTFL